MKFEELLDEQKTLINNYKNQYVIIVNRRYNSFQCICVVTEDEVICHVLSCINGHDYNVKTHYTFDEFIDAVKDYKIYKG